MLETGEVFSVNSTQHKTSSIIIGLTNQKFLSISKMIIQAINFRSGKMIDTEEFGSIITLKNQI